MLALAFGVWMESTFSEEHVYVKGTILLHFLQAHSTKGEIFISGKNKYAKLITIPSLLSSSF